MLARWDRRNQETVEWQRHLADEPARQPSLWVFVGISLAMVPVKLVLRRFLGFGWMMALLLAAMVGCFVCLFVTQRRRRRAWEAGRAVATSDR